MNWFTDVLTKKYAEFDGRARRTEFWMFTLISTLISIALAVVDTFVLAPTVGVGFLQPLYGLAVLVPSIAVGVRRLHDTGKSGLWYLLILVPCIGALVLIIFFVQDSQPGSNQYGPNPKGAAGRADDYDDRR